MNKFIYAFSQKAKENLMKQGCTLIKCDDINNTYIFICTDNIKFSELNSAEYAFSDTLSF